MSVISCFLSDWCMCEKPFHPQHMGKRKVYQLWNCYSGINTLIYDNCYKMINIHDWYADINEWGNMPQ